jgi:hypothetical protein
MKMRFGLVAGFGVGYYLGAKAGRERYIQINTLLRKARRSDAYRKAADQAEFVVDLAEERARGFIEERLPADAEVGSST